MTFTLDSAARILAGGSGDLLSLRGCQIYLAANGYDLDDLQMHAIMKRATEYRASLRHPPLTKPTEPVPAPPDREAVRAAMHYLATGSTMKPNPIPTNGGVGNGAVADVVQRPVTAPEINTEIEV